MANDRVYIRCPKCGETTLIATFWGAGDFHRPDFKPEDPRAGWEPTTQFLSKHGTECLGTAWGSSLPPRAGGFELVSEADLRAKPTADRPCLAGLCDRIYCDHMPDGSKRGYIVGAGAHFPSDDVTDD